MSVVKLPQDPESDIFKSLVNQAINSLKNSKIIALPTDTIYGLAGLAQSDNAVEKLYEIKQRQQDKPIAICVGSINDVKRWSNVKISDSILSDLLPGPVTLIFERSSVLNQHLNPTSTTIGVRIPQCAFVQALAEKCQQPIALTSANKSSAASSLNVEEFKELWPQLDLVVDNGTISSCSRRGSTVVDLSVPGEFLVVRNGCAYDHVVDILANKHGFKNCTPIS